MLIPNFQEPNNGTPATSETAETEDICSLPKDVGPCRASFKHLYFNSETGKCETLFYGGCMGNKNHFKTLEECKEACPEKA